MRNGVGALAACASACLVWGATAHAGVVSVNLNFATVNQNLWGPGAAVIIDESITIPPPAGISANLNPGSFSDPTSALASFLGFDVGVKISPTASFAAGLTASFYANSGSINLNYPKNVLLTIPSEVQFGQPFAVSASPPGPVSLLNLANTPLNAVVAAAGSGYATPALGNLLIDPVLHRFEPTAGFTTVFPYAEAKVDLDLKASGKITTAGCLVVCFDGPSINLGSVDLSQQLFELSTLSGLKVLDKPVVPFNQTVDVAQGVSIGFRSPNINLSGVLLADGSLEGSGAQTFLDFSFNVNQLIPLVGQILQSNIGPVGYDLLSVTPTVSLGLQQQISFDPKLMVALQFNIPVRDSRDDKVKNLVVFPVGETVELLPTIGGGVVSGGSLLAKPTFFLDNTIHNTTTLVLSGTLTVQALEIMTGATLGPFFDSGAINLGDIPLLVLNDRSWTLDIAPITGPTQTITRTGLGAILDYSVALSSPGSTNSLGHSLYDLFAAGDPVTQVFGQVMQIGASLIPCGTTELPDPSCQTVFLADDDVYRGNEPLGRLFCIFCNDLSLLFAPNSPILLDVATGEALLLADLSQFPLLTGLGQLLDPTSPLYDAQLATSQYYANFVSTRAALEGRSVPEPDALMLLLTGFIALALRRRRIRQGNRSRQPSASRPQ